MKQPKDKTLSIRTSAGIKSMLRAAADKEHRSVASMIEVLIMEYAQKNGISPIQPIASTDKKSKA